jgi:hypothetical protein
MHCTKQPLAASISGEYPPSSIRAMRTRRQTQHNNARAFVAET